MAAILRAPRRQSYSTAAAIGAGGGGGGGDASMTAGAPSIPGQNATSSFGVGGARGGFFGLLIRPMPTRSE